MDMSDIQQIKESERPALIDWEERGYGSYNNAAWIDFRDKLSQIPAQTCDRERKEITNEHLAKTYEDGNKPVIIQGLTDNWIGKISFTNLSISHSR